MAHFTYTAEKGGETYRGSAEAKDRFELYQIIRKEGGHVVSVDESTRSVWNFDLGEKFSRIGEYEKILFARNLGAMLSAGLPLARALAVLERQSVNKRLVIIVGAIAADVRHGETLHGALEKFPKYFPRIFVAMVRAGEEGGDLPQSLTVVADQMDRMYSLKKKIRGALIYPSIIVIAIIGIGAVMMVVVVPTLASTFAEMGAELPLSTRIIIAISNFLATHTILGAVLAVVSIGVITLFLRTKIGGRGMDWTFLRIPMIGGIVREVNAARTSRTLASLLTSGVDVLTSLEIVGQVVQNSYFKEVIADASKAVGRGEALSTTFGHNEYLYPAFVSEMMAVGEETGQTNEMLKKLAIFYEEEVDRKTKDLSTVIEPVLMLLIGGAVGFFAIAMIGPIYSMSNNI
ncbi:MAG: type II secretion system F family protein [bacterium]|nr:type II secretion system F family protein [bacterium]